MTGMFYPLKKAAERLHKTEQQLKEMIRQGKLREFRDGPNILLKIDEVEALASEPQVSKEPELPETKKPAAEQVVPEPGTIKAAPEEFEIPELPEQEPEIPPPQMPQEKAPVPEAFDLQAPEPELTDLEALEPEAPAPELQIPPPNEEPPESKALTEETAAVKPKTRAKRRIKPKPKIKTKASPTKLSTGQWLFRGLLDDSPIAVVTFCLLICAVILICAGLGYAVYALIEALK